MNVLSLCDGISGGQQALESIGITFDGVINRYYASEIADYSIKITQKNYPNTIQLGDMTKITNDTLDSLGKIDLLISGSPCKSLSRVNIDNYIKGLDGSSKLFWDFVRISDYTKPNFFLFENVETMKVSDRDIISDALKVEPVMINSDIFTAQERKRYYWTNIPIHSLPDECNLVLKDVMIDNPEEKLFYKRSFQFHGWDKKQIATVDLNTHEMCKRVYNPNMKCATLTAVNGGYQEKKVFDDGRCRKLTPLEYERLQGMGDNYTIGIPNIKRYCACGDSFTVPVIAHILKGIINQNN